MSAETPHFSAGHMCAGCPLGCQLHTGCVVEGTVEIIRDSFVNNSPQLPQPLLEETNEERQLPACAIKC